MSNEHNTQIIEIITKINDAMIINQNISEKDLKLLLLIIYNECFNNQESLDPLLKSYLTVLLHRFITIENNSQIIEEKKETTVPYELSDDKIKTSILNEQIIRQLIHSRAPQLMEIT